MTGDAVTQTEARAVPAVLVREVEALAYRISSDPQAWQLALNLRKLGLELVIQVQPLRSPETIGSEAVSP